MSSKISPKQLRMLAVVWVGVVLLVAVCVFLGILAALSNRGDSDVAEQPAGQAVATQPESAAQPTSIPATAGPTPTLQPTIAPNQDTTFGYGIQAQLHKDTEGTINMINQLGMGWVKQQIRWTDLEPIQGEPNWAALDPIFAATSAQGLKVMVSIVAAPEWAAQAEHPEWESPPVDPQTYATYVGQFVERYSGAIHAVEVWNEMNLGREWYTGRALDPAEYIQLLEPTSAAIRAADPNVIIISGALAPTGVNDPTGESIGMPAMEDFGYMTSLINQGMLDYVDCVGAHANGINLPPDLSYEEAAAQGAPEGFVYTGSYNNPHYSWSFYSTLNGYHDIIVAAGGNTPLCVTEFGWATVEGMEGDPREGFEFAYDNTLESQAENIVRGFELMHEWGFVRLAFLFNLDYSPKAGGNTQDDTTLFSILAPNGAPRPAFEAVRDMSKPE